MVILVADDDLTFSRALREILSHAGHDVMLAANGKEVVSMSEYVALDLALIDIFMPEMDGLEAIMQLHVRFPDVKIIAMSGGYYFGKLDLLSTAKLLGASTCLAKPFSPDILLEAIHA